MSGTKINNFSIGDSNIQSVMLTLDKAYKGLHQVSLTNYDNTSESQIAAGSVVENNGALYQFTSNESITGSPSDGTVYIRLVPNGDTITAEYTNTAPTWSDSKQGWYGTSTDANKRYLEFVITKTTTSWVSATMKNATNGENFLKSFVTASGSASLSGGAGTFNMTKSIDILDEFDNSTEKFQPKKPGVYLISGQMTYSAFTGYGYQSAVFNISGSQRVVATIYATSPNQPVINFSDMVFLNASDYIILRTSGTGGPASASCTARIKKID